MKLIDLLVQELPKRGGWPDGVGDIEMLEDGCIYFDGDDAPEDFKLPQCSDGWNRLKSARDYSNAVTREQYEAALNKPIWDGEGLPPVGCECEVLISKEWQKCEILVHTRFGTIDCAVFKTESILNCYPEGHFRPIRSERDEAINQIAELIGRGTFHTDATSVYDAIARGDIPGVKLSD